MPMLAPDVKLLLFISKGDMRESIIRSPILFASAMSCKLVNVTENSSPPKRASNSLLRKTPAIRLATSINNRSPTS